MVLFIGAGAVGVIGIVVAYRRQLGVEQGRFLEGLAQAAQMLGAQDSTVQAAGVYALAGLADSEGPVRRQECVDVLCAYLRLPYIRATESDKLPGALTTITLKRSQTTSDGPQDEELTLVVRPHDRLVRGTIIRVITQHLREDAEVRWSALNLDFTGITCDHGDFSGAVFGGKINFRGATFPSGHVSFEGAKFHGSLVDFSGARFIGGVVNFKYAQFTDGHVSFEGAEFIAGEASFLGADFAGGEVSFTGAQFKGSVVDFRKSGFAGGTVRFCEAAFTGGTVDFRYPRTWSLPPEVPWSDVGKVPQAVMPQQWPPDVGPST